MMLLPQPCGPAHRTVRGWPESHRPTCSRQRFGVRVIDVQVMTDRVLELTCRPMRAVSKVFFSERGKPSFDMVKPRRRGGCEVNMEAWMTSERGFDRGRFVRAVVVHYQMHLQVRRHACFDGARKAHKFAAAMAPMYLTDYFTSSDVQRRDQGRCTVAHVIVGASLRDAGCHR